MALGWDVDACQCHPHESQTLWQPVCVAELPLPAPVEPPLQPPKHMETQIPKTI